MKSQIMNDRCIMYDLIQLNLTTTELIQLNARRMYRHVSLLSNITTPNEKIIMIKFQRGMKPTYPRSTLYWPNQESPSKSSWKGGLTD